MEDRKISAAEAVARQPDRDEVMSVLNGSRQAAVCGARDWPSRPVAPRR